MVGVPGSLVTRDFTSQEDVKVKEEYREEVPTNAGSTEALLNTARSTDQRGMEKISGDRHEADLDQDTELEEKPRIPLKAARAVIADLDENLDLHTTDKETTTSKSNLSTNSVATTRSPKKKKIKTAQS
ncbi:LOW QUALITY PROTEIN: hypothetical protein PHMEG_00025775 [Phytophthora megakarya]|uniref:Uncharacterized protein n=1 Tax=Phytophthora megakarya TaxID=4795 RepID=A0A225VBC4_9STRA|nr:LOW QUALITY PROTEIN: hypothetical protein PHMEG_00025775 [Phytophthora megakarya]